MYKVDEITPDVIYKIIRRPDAEEYVKKLLRQASCEIENFDSFRSNMQVRVYGANDTYIITAGKGENVLKVQMDGSNNIKCTWTGHSTMAKVYKVYKVCCPVLCKVLIDIITLKATRAIMNK